MSEALRHIGGHAGSCHLVCFPYAGASSDAFAGLGALLPSGIDLWAVDLAGRLRRSDEPPASSFTAAVDDVAQALIGRFANEAVVFYGHSMGGYLAVETALRLEDLGHHPLAHIMVGACASPDQVEFSDFGALAHADDAALLSVVKDWGLPLPQHLLASPAAAAIALHGLRLDLTLLSTYKPISSAQLVAPMSAVCGAEDPDVRVRQCQGWSRHTASWKGTTELAGGHLFIATHMSRLAALLGEASACTHPDHG